jgi:D-serine deaminase-like pyridoxal phosphate-dependent protein
MCDRLANDDDVRCEAERSEDASHPGAGGHHDRADTQVAGCGRDEHRVILHYEAPDRRLVGELDAVLTCCADEGVLGPVGVQHPTVRLKQGLAVLVGLQPEASFQLGRVQELEVCSTLFERLSAAGDLADVDGSRRREDLVAALVLELPPARKGFLTQAHERRIRVRELEDTGVAVTGPASVAEPELLEHDHAPPGSGKSSSCSQPHHARPDDDDLRVHLVLSKPSCRGRCESEGRAGRLLENLVDRVSAVAGAQTIRHLPTPFLTIDLDAVERNIARMQAYCDSHAIALRPHVKTHKMPLIAALQVRAGARGITCQKLGEAELMAAHGFDDILLTFPLLGTGKAERLAALAGNVRVVVGADSDLVARTLSSALAAGSSTAGFLIECDTGFGRTGVQTPTDAADLAELVERLPNLEFKGLMTHPATTESAAWLRAARTEIERRGIEVGCISGGGTPQAFHIHESGVFTELRAGTYVLGDRRLAVEGVVSLDDCALRVVSTVVSRPTPSRAILDAGSKTLSSDALPGLEDDAYGLVVEYPDGVLSDLSEEHGIVDVSRCSRKPDLGEVVTIVPNHACAAVNLHDAVALHRLETDVELADVPGRGLVR